MTWGLLATAIVAMLIVKNPAVLQTILTSPAILWGSAIAEIVLVVILSARVMQMSFASAALTFGAYAVLNGVTMSVIFAAYTQESIAQAFFITAGTFGAMSVVGYVVKKDLSTMGRTLMMLLIGLIIATIVNIFLHNEGLMAIINYVGVLVFVGLTAYDTQKIKNILEECTYQGMEDQAQKIALMGSLTLYLDFINMFLYILRIFGNRK